MASESQQKKLSRVRRPRVHITYDVHTGDATVKRELPFVVGVVGDFSGDPSEPLKKLKDRNFIQIDRDNFNAVLDRMKPGLNLRVENTLEDDGSEIAVQLKFKSMEDFEPARIVEQVKPLRELMETRRKLIELQTKVDLADDLEDKLQGLLSDPDALKKAGVQVSAEDSSESSEEGGE